MLRVVSSALPPTERHSVRRLLFIFSVILASCVSSGEEIGSADHATRQIDHGVTFANSSALLAPFSRSANGEGLGGLAWLDYDQDGDLDLYLTNSVTTTNALFSNNGDGTFSDVTFAAGVHNGFGSSGVVAGDIDNDGYPELFVSGEGHIVGPGQTPTRLYHNNGDGTFSEISGLAGVSAASSEFGSAMADINGDGYLDIFVAAPGHIPFLTGPGTGLSPPSKLYLNNGDLTFTEIAASAGVTGEYLLPGVGIVTDGACVPGFTDYDGDGDQDLLVGNCNAFPFAPFPLPVRPTPFNLYRNNGDLTFTDVTLAAGLNVPGFWMGLAFGDVDNDGDVDFFSTSTGTFTGHLHALMTNNGDGTFSNDGIAAGVAISEFGWGTTMADYDNDGDLDMYQVGALPLFGVIGPGKASPGRLFFNDGAGNFTDTTSATGVNLSFSYSSGVAQADYDGDGFADLVVMTAPWSAGGFSNPSGAPVLLRNQGNNNHSITVRLVGTRSNAGGVGARVEVKTGHERQVREVRAGSSMASTDSPWPSFGIGHRDEADVTVSWPSGLVEEFDDIDADQLVTLTEGTGEAEDEDEDED